MASEFTWKKDSPEKLLVVRFHITTDFHDGQRDIITRIEEKPICIRENKLAGSH